MSDKIKFIQLKDAITGEPVYPVSVPMKQEETVIGNIDFEDVGQGDTPPMGLHQGGTGATNSLDARKNLDVYSKNEITSLLKNIDGDNEELVNHIENQIIHISAEERDLWNTVKNKFDSNATIPIENGGTGNSTIEMARQNMNYMGSNPITSSTEDTPDTWAAFKSGHALFNKKNLLVEQPYQYGFLESFTSNGTTVLQRFVSTTGGVWYRAGVAGEAWNVNESGKIWTKMIDETGGTVGGSFIANNFYTSATGGYFTKDKTGYTYPAIYDNGTNLHIGAMKMESKHHIGNTYISSGHNGTSGNETIYVEVPNEANNNSSAYGVFHTGYLNVSKANAGVLPISHGGTAVDMTEAPPWAIMRKASEGYDQIYYTPTANGAFYATATNGAAKFGTLPIAQGGTGATSGAGAITNLGIRKGLVSITPSAANTPTAKTISWLTMTGTPRVALGVESTVPGTNVTGVSYSDATTTGCKIYLTRTNTTQTNISYIAI